MNYQIISSNAFGTVPVAATAQTQPASSSVPAPFGGMEVLLTPFRDCKQAIYYFLLDHALF